MLGTVRLNVPASLAGAVIAPILQPLLAENPGLHLNIVATDRPVVIAEEGFDAGIRMGEHLSRDTIAVKIGPAPRFAVVASPDYARRRGLPQTPGDLAGLDSVRYRFPSGAFFHWEFEHKTEVISVEVRGPVTLDSQPFMVEAALAGAGLAYVWDFQLTEHLAAGRLVRYLEDWCPPLDVCLSTIPARNISQRVCARRPTRYGHAESRLEPSLYRALKQKPSPHSATEPIPGKSRCAPATK